MAENERLAVLENQYNALQTDVTEIKGDVKSLVATQQQLALALSIREATEAAQVRGRRDTGTWVRSFLPLVMSAIAAIVSIVALVTK